MTKARKIGVPVPPYLPLFFDEQAPHRHENKVPHNHDRRFQKIQTSTVIPAKGRKNDRRKSGHQWNTQDDPRIALQCPKCGQREKPDHKLWAEDLVERHKSEQRHEQQPRQTSDANRPAPACGQGRYCY